jgi:hypothetical protein
VIEAGTAAGTGQCDIRGRPCWRALGGDGDRTGGKLGCVLTAAWPVARVDVVVVWLIVGKDVSNQALKKLVVVMLLVEPESLVDEPRTWMFCSWKREGRMAF